MRLQCFLFAVELQLMIVNGEITDVATIRLLCVSFTSFDFTHAASFSHYVLCDSKADTRALHHLPLNPFLITSIQI